MRHLFTIGDEKAEAALVRRRGEFVLLFNGREFPIALRHLDDGSAELEVDGHLWRAEIAVDGDETFVHLDGESHAVRWSDPLVRLAKAAAGATDDVAPAPMPGTIISVTANPGDRVTRGQTLMVIESMKLQTAIIAWRDGVVKAIHLEAGRSFDRGASLVTLEPAGEG